MDYYGYIFVRECDLTHHGILGQKWGKKNGPPYPLADSKHSSREKKAGWKKSLKTASDLDDDSKRAARIKKGKKITKGLLIGVGAITVSSLAVLAVTANGGPNKNWIDKHNKYGNLKAKNYKRPKGIKRYPESRQVESDVFSWASGQTNVPDLVRWSSNKYLYYLSKNVDGTFTVMLRKRLPGTYDGLSERNKNDEQ